MQRNFGSRVLPLFVLAAVFQFLPRAFAQPPARPQITQRVDESRLHVLAGNTRAPANAANDQGRVDDDFRVEHMLLQLKRSPEQEQAVAQLVDRLHNPESAAFHQWMTAAEFGRSFGASAQDVNTVRTWLESHGFTVNSIYPNGVTVDFSGTAAQLRAAFHTEIHYLDVNGEMHVANMSDPQIPAALAPAIEGLASLHDFRPRALHRPRMLRRPQALYTFVMNGDNFKAVVPGDLAVIYNLKPLFAAGITGKGESIAVIEDTDLYSNADWSTFRSTFGLTQYSSGTLTVLHPAPAVGGSNCGAPGVNADDGEAILDAEWASAAAPDAAIIVASCANTRSTWGGLIAIQNLVNSVHPPSIISISYGECEAENGSGLNAAFNSIYQQAVAEGISVFVAAGDEGAASCDAGATAATHGIGISGFASTPYNVAVGGTDFADGSEGTGSRYWNPANSSIYESALSYIPEIPWNDSCAGTLLAQYLHYATTYGANGFCNSSVAKADQFLDVAAGSGGPSGCATGVPATSGVVGGSCKGVAKPSWQSIAGVPSDGVRDIPDVSLMAADGLWGHYYVMCYSDRRNGGAPCTGAPDAWAGGGGTSFAAPIVAGVQALVNQKLNAAQGNPNYVYYKLAQSAGSVCNSANGDMSVSPCVFHNVTQGDIDVNCGGTHNCYGAGAAQLIIHSGRNIHTGEAATSDDGALSLSNTALTPAYGTASGWNFATGIGSINAYNLVMNWP